MKKIAVIILVSGLLLLNGCGGPKVRVQPFVDLPSQDTSPPRTALPDLPEPAPFNLNNMATQLITLQTSDQITLTGDWSVPKDAKKAVLLLHMMPAVRQSWEPLVKALNKAGFATMTIDLRGHGESTQNGQLDYQKFSDSQHQASRLDVDAAMNFIKSKGFTEENISFVGASIGANLSLDALRRYSNVPHAVVLSPGLNYRGITTEPVMKELEPTQKTWLVAAESDTPSAEAIIILQQMKPQTATLTMYGGANHGTNLFQSEPLLISDIVKFLSA
ncbi:MAG: alpha/beta fold hydrolase [Patescibacteria group bacterium]